MNTSINHESQSPRARTKECSRATAKRPQKHAPHSKRLSQLFSTLDGTAVIAVIPIGRLQRVLLHEGIHGKYGEYSANYESDVAQHIKHCLFVLSGETGQC